ncbi:MAG: COG2740: Predicted nucleic-acid-binding protein implicated in transcription termination, partial [uncultured Nocardioidaceae bacterium]
GVPGAGRSARPTASRRHRVGVRPGRDPGPREAGAGPGSLRASSSRVLGSRASSSSLCEGPQGHGAAGQRTGAGHRLAPAGEL